MCHDSDMKQKQGNARFTPKGLNYLKQINILDIRLSSLIIVIITASIATVCYT